MPISMHGCVVRKVGRPTVLAQQHACVLCGLWRSGDDSGCMGLLVLCGPLVGMWRGYEGSSAGGLAAHITICRAAKASVSDVAHRHHSRPAA